MARPLPEDPEMVEREVLREIRRAAKKALRKIGREARKARRADLRRAFRRVSRRRLAAVRAYVGRHGGQLIIADHAPMSAIQETGGVIRARGDRGLSVGLSGASAPGSIDRSGRFIRARRGGAILASFQRQVRVGAIRVGFHDTAERIAKQFETEFEEALGG